MYRCEEDKHINSMPAAVPFPSLLTQWWGKKMMFFTLFPPEEMIRG